MRQVFDKRLPHLLAEHAGKIVGADIGGLRHSVEREIFVGIVLVNVAQRPLEHGFILIAGLLLAQVDGAAQKRSAAFYQRLAVDIRCKLLPGKKRAQKFLL